MSHILYIGCYRDFSSFGRVCRDYLISLIESGVDVTCQPLFYSYPSVKELDSRIIEREKFYISSDTILIQHLPHDQLCPDKRFKKNVAIVSLYGEPPAHILADIKDRLLLFDQVITTNHIAAHYLNAPYVIHHPVNLASIDNKEKIKNLGDHYVFYTIGKMSRRKNLDAIISAFHLEFDPDEPVELLVKTCSDVDGSVAQKVISEYVTKMKSSLGKWKKLEYYKGEHFVLSHVLDESLSSVHNAGNCFVTATHGEYSDYLLTNALVRNKQVVCNDVFELPMFDYYSVSNKYSFVKDSSVNNLTSFNDHPMMVWSEISIPSLMYQMRRAYANKHLTENIKEINIQGLGYKSSGKALWEWINK